MAVPSFVYGWAIQYLVGEIAEADTNTDWNKVKANVNAKVADLVHSQWISSQAGKDLGLIIDAAAAIGQDTPELTSMLTDLSQKNWQAAEVVLISEVSKRLPQLAGLLSSL